MTATLTAPTSTATAGKSSFSGSLSREALQHALRIVSPAIPAKASLPVLSTVKLAMTAAGLRATGTDLDLMIETVIAADVAGEGAICVAHKKLAELTNELPAGSISLATQASKLRVRAGRSTTSFVALEAEEFPTVETASQGGVQIKAGDLQQHIGRVAFAVSTEESRPTLNGVLLELRPTSLTLTATNGHRLSTVAAPVALAADAPSLDLILPVKALVAIGQVFAADEMLMLTASANRGADVDAPIQWLTIASETTTLRTRLIEGPYPNYRQVIPTENDKVMTADRAALMATIKRVLVMAPDEAHRVRLALAAGTLAISTQTADMGEGSDQMAVEYEGADLDIGFNGHYLLEMLKRVPTAGVVMTFLAPERAASVLPQDWAADGATMEGLVMPLRLVD